MLLCRNREMQSGRDDQNSKDLMEIDSQSQTSRGSSAAPRGIKGAVGRDNRAGLSVSTTTCQNVQTVEHVAKGVMCAFRQTASKATPVLHSAQGRDAKALQGQD